MMSVPVECHECHECHECPSCTITKNNKKDDAKCCKQCLKIVCDYCLSICINCGMEACVACINTICQSHECWHTYVCSECDEFSDEINKCETCFMHICDNCTKFSKTDKMTCETCHDIEKDEAGGIDEVAEISEAGGGGVCESRSTIIENIIDPEHLTSNPALIENLVSNYKEIIDYVSSTVPTCIADPEITEAVISVKDALDAELHGKDDNFKLLVTSMLIEKIYARVKAKNNVA